MRRTTSSAVNNAAIAATLTRRFATDAIMGIDELAADGDHDGADTWRRIAIAVEQLANTTPTAPLH